MATVPRFSLIILTLLFLFTLPTVVFADCAAPSSPGVRICSPTPNATVVYVPTIDFNTAPTSGAEIVKYAVYDNSRKTWQDASGSTGTTLIDPSIKNGLHTLVINAWDSSGKLYQSRVSFRVTGDGFPFGCALPSSPGVNFCSPPSNAVLSTNYPTWASATGKSSIAAMRLYIDGKAITTQTNVNQFGGNGSVGTQGNHKLTVVAWDKSGNVYSSSRILRSIYKFTYFDCPPKGTDPCRPGFSGDSVSPQQDAYTGNAFTLMANILQNPRPITTMKAYIDNTLVATANGPTMTSPVENAPNGTHILTFQAWDTGGVMYRIQYNINVNVPH